MVSKSFLSNLLGPILGGTGSSALGLQAASAGTPDHPFLNFLGDVASGLQSVYNAPVGTPGILGAVSSVGQRMALRNYVAQEQALQQKKAQQTGQLYGPLLPQFNGQSVYLDPEDLAGALPGYGNQDFGKASTQLQQGQLPTSYGLSPAAQVQQQTQDINQQQGKVANFQTLPSAPGVIGMGQNAGLPVGTPSAKGFTSFLANKQLPPSTVRTSNGRTLQLQTLAEPQQTQGGQTLSANAASGPGPLSLGTDSPFGYPTDFPAQATNLIQSGLTNLQHSQTLSETTRHNRVGEGIDKTNAGANVTRAKADILRAQKYQVYPPGSNAPPRNSQGFTPAEELKGLDTTLESIGGVDSKTGQLKPVAWDNPRYQEYMSAVARKQQLLGGGSGSFQGQTIVPVGQGSGPLSTPFNPTGLRDTILKSTKK